MRLIFCSLILVSKIICLSAQVIKSDTFSLQVPHQYSGFPTEGFLYKERNHGFIYNPLENRRYSLNNPLIDTFTISNFYIVDKRIIYKISDTKLPESLRLTLLRSTLPNSKKVENFMARKHYPNEFIFQNEISKFKLGNFEINPFMSEDGLNLIAYENPKDTLAVAEYNCISDSLSKADFPNENVILGQRMKTLQNLY
ncbi:MAG: hypothetical protein KG003_15335 [Bacteroidetes bacterium]|nr:hypothetical protein [Bacteroidota bacterium]